MLATNIRRLLGRLERCLTYRILGRIGCYTASSISGPTRTCTCLIVKNISFVYHISKRSCPSVKMDEWVTDACLRKHRVMISLAHFSQSENRNHAYILSILISWKFADSVRWAWNNGDMGSFEKPFATYLWCGWFADCYNFQKRKYDLLWITYDNISLFWLINWCKQQSKT